MPSSPTSCRSHRGRRARTSSTSWPSSASRVGRRSRRGLPRSLRAREPTGELRRARGAGSAGLRSDGLYEHPHGVRAEDQALRLAIEGEAAVEELRSLLAPVAAPITFGTVRAVAVEGGVDVEGVESRHV